MHLDYNRNVIFDGFSLLDAFLNPWEQGVWLGNEISKKPETNEIILTWTFEIYVFISLPFSFQLLNPLIFETPSKRYAKF